MRLPLPWDRCPATRALIAPVQEVDFRDAQAVRDAHQRLQASIAASIDTTHILGNGLKPVASALASLQLGWDAALQQESTTHLPDSQEHAFQTLAEHLSPAGREGLWQALACQAGNTHALTHYLAPSEQWYLAGQLRWNDALRHKRAGEPTQAHAAYQQAAAYFDTAAQTLTARFAAAQVIGADIAAAKLLMLAGRACRHAGDHVSAAAYFQMAGGRSSHAQDLPAAIRAYGLAAQAFYEAQQHQQAGEISLRAAELLITQAEDLMTKGQHEVATAALTDAAVAYWAAADNFDEANRPEQATHAKDLAARTYLRATLPGHTQ